MIPTNEIVPKNVQKLADYINRQKDPERFMAILLSACKPSMDDITNRQQESQVSVR